MKKTYMSPMLSDAGRAVRDTLNGWPNVGIETMTSRVVGAGAVGYYL